MIILPWPDKALHPNARPFWAVKARVTRNARISAAWATKASGMVLPQHEGLFALQIAFYPPDNRRRDDDGLTASFKPYRDGIADALGIDDSRFVSTARLMRGQVRKGGQVEVTIEAMA